MWGNSWSLVISFHVPWHDSWHDYSLPKVSSKLGLPLQSYRKDKIMATLNSKIKLDIRCPLVWLFTTQSFIQIGLTIAELQKDKIMATLNSKNQIRHKAPYGMGIHHPKFCPNWAHRCRVTALRNIWQPWTKKLRALCKVPWPQDLPHKVSSKSVQAFRNA